MIQCLFSMLMAHYGTNCRSQQAHRHISAWLSTSSFSKLPSRLQAQQPTVSQASVSQQPTGGHAVAAPMSVLGPVRVGDSLHNTDHSSSLRQQPSNYQPERITHSCSKSVTPIGTAMSDSGNSLQHTLLDGSHICTLLQAKHWQSTPLQPIIVKAGCFWEQQPHPASATIRGRA
jgi:hypothetical protein